MADHGALAGEVAVVTGASAGLGRHFAVVLARAGAQVALAARRRPALDRAVVEIRKQGGTACAAVMDVTDDRSIAAAFDEIAAALGPPTILVNNAGIARDAPLDETDEADWDGVVDTNLKGAFLCARAFARRRRASGGGGRIVNVSSILGLTASPRVHGYAAAKAGLIQLTRTLAVELARDGILVNALAPGYVATDLNRALLAGPIGERLKARVPLRRFAEPGDLDGALLLLASPATRYMTGAVVVVDGGMTLSTL